MTTRSIRLQLVLLVAATLFAGYADAERRLVHRTLGIEASTEGVLLPSGSTGKVLFKSCPTCPQSNLEVGSETEFFVGPDAVDFATLKRFIASGGPYFMMLYHRPGQTVLSRIVVAARLDARSQ